MTQIEATTADSALIKAEKPVKQPKSSKEHPIRIAIADDHTIFRDGLRRLLGLEEDMQIVGEAKDGSEVADILRDSVKNHLHNIFDKLGVSDRLELALYAIHRNIRPV